MYHHSFLFVITSDNGLIEEALQEIAPLEDCDYTFQTVPCGQDPAVEPSRLDVAYVYDCIGGAEFPGEEEHEECILVAGEGNPVLTDTAVAACVSDIWCMPRHGYDEKLLDICFRRLVKRMKQNADARKQGICFDTLINSVPDIAWFKDVKGLHLIVNDSFCEMVGKTKERIYKKGHCYIWNASKKDEKVCLSSDQIIMKSRTTNTFEESIKTRNGIQLLKSYKSALIDTNGEIFGTCGIAHDVTALRNMSTELDMVLDSVPFAVVVEDMQGIVVNKNVHFDKYFPQFTDIVGKSSEEWKSSLTRKLLMEDRLKEVVVQSDEEEQILVFDEEPILDNSRRSIGKIVTLTDITLERSIYQQSEHMANTDFLTGLCNRRGLMQHLEEVYTRDDVALVMMDLDNFKQVNDTLGHDAGDRALVQTSENLRALFGEDFIVRLGGDEFMVVTCGREAEQVRQDTEQWLDMMRNAHMKHRELKGVTASAGIVFTAAIPQQQRTIAELMQTVDELLYKAKKNGKNRCCVYGENN